MQLDDFSYDLPPHLIAQHPAARRDGARLMVVRRDGAPPEHREFADLPQFLRRHDVLVLNDTRVLPARLLGRRVRTGGRWEGLYLRSHPDQTWEMMAQAGGRVEPGEAIQLSAGPLTLTLVRRGDDGHWFVRPSEDGTAEDLLAKYGTVPLPPYIRKGVAGETDVDRYQTVYADKPGSVAAPTAGLHFTPALLARLAAAGVETARVTLHVGPGTFQPVRCESVEDHQMHVEWGECPAETADAVRRCRAAGGRVVAVGTTAVRVLESAAGVTSDGAPSAWRGETRLFIYPPYRFRAVDVLITNFHLPRSTLLMLVAAFAGPDVTRGAYLTAIEQGYRFYSYGDAMLVV